MTCFVSLVAIVPPSCKKNASHLQLSQVREPPSIVYLHIVHAGIDKIFGKYFEFVFILQTAAYWDIWTQWTSCSSSCDNGGTRRRTRVCIDMCNPNNPGCSGGDTATEQCNSDQACTVRLFAGCIANHSPTPLLHNSCFVFMSFVQPISCVLGEWQDASTCNAQCPVGGTAGTASGTITQVATVLALAQYNGGCIKTRTVPCTTPCNGKFSVTRTSSQQSLYQIFFLKYSL